MGKIKERLKNPPLVEVIVEVRWELTDVLGADAKIDPHYMLLPGKLNDALASEYPHYEKLPQASIPDEISPYLVKHRFRKTPGGWPLVQLGPGILTVNHTEKYTTFDEFCPLAVAVVDKLFEIYPQKDALSISSLLLRYIDAKDFDYENHNVIEFIDEKMGVPLSLPKELFGGTGVSKKPASLAWNASFPCEAPAGLATLKFTTGLSKNRPALIWEQIVTSSRDEVPDMPHGFEDWIRAAHGVTESWFLSLIKGDLEKEFSGGKL